MRNRKRLLTTLFAVFAAAFALGVTEPVSAGSGCGVRYECNCGGWFEEIGYCGSLIISRQCTNWPC